jgi:integrase
MAGLLYGSGLRLMECMRLRVKDVDFAHQQIVVRDGKGRKDRVTMLPHRFQQSLGEHLARAKEQHDNDLAQGFGAVYLWPALERKYPNAAREWIWQYVFPSGRLSVDPRSGKVRRHHIHENALQRAVKETAVSEHGTQTINVLPSHMRDHDAPTLETRPGVCLRPQSGDKRFIETSPLVPSIQGFPPLLA